MEVQNYYQTDLFFLKLSPSQIHGIHHHIYFLSGMMKYHIHIDTMWTQCPSGSKYQK